MKKVFSLLSLALLVLLIFGCNQPTEPGKTTPPSPATYTVTFNANGGSGTMAPQTFTEGVPKALTENSFTPPTNDNGFYYWNTKDDGTGTTYADGETISTSENTKLYAIWLTYTPRSEFEFNPTDEGEITKYTGSDSIVHIPPSVEGVSVTGIGDNAFKNNKKIITVTIPDGVTSIGSNVFEHCTSLQSISIPDGVTYIGRVAFSNCSSLKSITIPHGVTSIGDSAFNGCSNLQSITIPNSVTSIGGGAFNKCSSLQSITIPNGIKSIGPWTFQDCRSLENITIPNSVTSIGMSAFNGCSSLQSITIPNSVTSISFQAFPNNHNLENIIVESGNTHYESEAGVLYNEDKTELIQYPAGKQETRFPIPDSIKTITQHAFEGCSNLESIIIPSSVITIKYSAFYNCDNLQSITIPNSITTIENGTFSGCNSLHSITIPTSVTSIRAGAFYECNNLTTVYTNYTKDDYPPYDKSAYIGWMQPGNEKFFEADWKPIPTL